VSSEKIPLRVEKGMLVPADGLALEKLKAKGYTVGDIVHATLAKPRNPQFHRLAHALGFLVSENIEAFHGLDAHTTLKRLQIESGLACEEIGLRMPKVGYVVYRMPLSMSFQSMNEGEFKELIRGLSRYIAKEYWPDLHPDQIEDMASCMVNE
jgi:hypothetical protein